MQTIVPIYVGEALPQLESKLIEVLQALGPEEWTLPTVAGQWQVRDVAAHLLDGNLRSLSMLRDGHFGVSPNEPIDSYTSLLKYLNALNAQWVEAMRRLSQPVLVELLASTGPQFTAYLLSLEPFEPAAFSVAWAGEAQSYNWFHVAREYTERWHHQQQIRLAVGQEHELYTPQLYRPYLDTSMRALPHHYRSVLAPEGSTVKIEVLSEGGGSWCLRKGAEGWLLVEPDEPKPNCRVRIEGTVAWRLFTKGIARSAAEQSVGIEGDKRLGVPIFEVLAVMA